MVMHFHINSPCGDVCGGGNIGAERTPAHSVRAYECESANILYYMLQFMLCVHVCMVWWWSVIGNAGKVAEEKERVAVCV